MKTHADAKKISLQNQSLEKADLKVIAKFVRKSDVLEELDLSFNDVCIVKGNQSERF